MIGEGEGRCEIGGAVFGRAVDAGLEGIALAAAEPLRQAPIGAAAGKCETHHGIWCEAIIEAASEADCPRGQIMAADHERDRRWCDCCRHKRHPTPSSAAHRPAPALVVL